MCIMIFLLMSWVFICMFFHNNVSSVLKVGRFVGGSRLFCDSKLVNVRFFRGGNHVSNSESGFVEN